MELCTQVEEEAGRLAGETAGRSKDKVGGNQKIGDVGGVDFASHSDVVAGRAFVFEYSSSIGGEPDETEGGSVEMRGSGAKVVERQMVFVEGKDFSQMEGGHGGVANGDDGGGVESSGGDHVVMRGRWVLGSAERTDVDDRSLKFSA